MGFIFAYDPRGSHAPVDCARWGYKVLVGAVPVGFGKV